MLLFQDILELITSEARKHIETVNEKDVIFDPTEHAHITIRLIRYQKENNFKPKMEAIKEDVEKMPFVKSIKFESGYLNINLDSSYLYRAISESIETTGTFPDSFQDPERVSVEHTSTNPTGPIHMGRIRNSIIGDSLSRLISRYGYRVVTQYYVNDSGKQMISLYLGYEKFHKGEPVTEEILLDGYRKIYEYLEKVGSEGEVENLMELYEKGDGDLISKVREIAQVMLDRIVEDMKALDIHMDEFTWESEFITTGETKEVVSRLSESLHDENGAKYIDVPDVRKIFLMRGNGTSLYLTRDIAYHMYKFSQYDRCIVVVGEDQKEHGKVMKYIMNDLLEYPNSLEYLFYGMVGLESGKMSTRKGTGVYARDVYKQLVEKAREEVIKRYKDGEDVDDISRKIAVSSLRFYMLKVSTSKPITFKWEDALDFNGETAPFIMYSYTRAGSILKKVTTSGKADFKDMKEEEEALLVEMYKYPYKIIEAYRNLKPEVLTNYLLVLSRKFMRFYENCNIMGEETNISNRRVEIVKMFMKIMKDASYLVGIEHVDRM